MHPIRNAVYAVGLVAASAAVLVAGCKGSSLPPFPQPSVAPTFAPGVVAEYPIPTANATPGGLATGPDGNLWFTEINGNRIGRITTAGAITEYNVPTAGAQPADIIQGPGPNHYMFFTEFGGNKIGFFSTANPGSISEIPLANGNAGPSGLAVDGAGNIWFGEVNNGGFIGKITGTSLVSETPLPGNTSPVALTLGPDGNVWVLDQANNNVDKFSPASGPASATAYGVVAGTSVGFGFITPGADGNVWFTESNVNAVGRITPSGAISQFAPFTALSAPFGIVSAADGNIWFAEAAAGQVGRIKVGTGAMTEFGIPGNGTIAVTLANGPDNNIWFTDWGTNQIGKIVLANVPASSVRKPLSQRPSFKIRWPSRRITIR